MKRDEKRRLLQRASDLQATPEELRELSLENDEISIEVAKNPICPPSLLQTLAARAKILARAVTQNPNTPKELLFQLGMKHPKELLQNPLLEMVTLEDPNFWGKAPAELLIRILSRKEAPVEALCRFGLASHESVKVRQTLAAHPNTPSDILFQLVGDDDFQVRKKASENPKTPAPFSQIATAQFVQSYEEKAYYLAKGPTLKERWVLSEEVLRQMARSGPWLRRVAACLSETPKDVLQALTQDPVSHVALDALSNPQTPTDHFLPLLEKPAAARAIARRPDCTTKLLEEIWQRTKPNLPNYHWIQVAIAIAYHKNTGLPLLEDLARERKKVQTRSDTDHRDFCIAVAINPSCSEEIFLSILPKEKGAFWLEDRTLPGYKGLPVELMEFLIDCPASAGTRALLAGNPSLPESLADRLAEDPELYVRTSLASRTDLSSFARQALWKNGSPKIKELLKKGKKP